ncbi:hypothetical protein MLD38_026303 [Melastoma candidum]|uniref:Uncharacterized protein n=1 Tax=Melastoma candidum TaxID=119954 RepID=A0ACB9P4T1_9MYRT|nr:hypothetical protein MLD38_026303 [Melastoma candidum]
MSSSPPSPYPPMKPQPLPAPSNTPTAAPKPVPWTHEETVHLIQTYQSTWYSLNRNHLRSQHWEAVSAAVADLCSYPPTHPTLKSTSQCRHKMEKLRKRYRSDRKRILQGSMSVSPWPYYDLMDQLEHGPRRITDAHPVKAARTEDDDDEEDERGFGGGRNRRVRSVDYILRRAGVVNRFAASGTDSGARVVVPEAAAEKRKRVEEGGDGKREKVMRGLAEEIRGMAEKYVGVEEVKMEMVRETERWRMDMERKRLDLIIDSQRKLVEAIAKAFGS